MQSFTIIQPSPILHRYIRHYWILQSDMANAAPERTFPLGCIQLFFHKKKRLFSQTHHKMQPRYFVCGQEKGYTDILLLCFNLMRQSCFSGNHYPFFKEKI